MSERPRRKGQANRDVHEVIRATAEEIRSLSDGGLSHAASLPQPVADLIDTCARAVHGSVPKVCEFEGRRYYLRSAMLLRLDIFDDPASSVPLLRVAVGSPDELGHVPAH